MQLIVSCTFSIDASTKTFAFAAIPRVYLCQFNVLQRYSHLSLSSILIHLHYICNPLVCIGFRRFHYVSNSASACASFHHLHLSSSVSSNLLLERLFSSFRVKLFMLPLIEVDFYFHDRWLCAFWSCLGCHIQVNCLFRHFWPLMKL